MQEEKRVSVDDVELTEEERILLKDERSCIFETRVDRAGKCRDYGSTSFKEKKLKCAIEWYERGLYHVAFDEGTWHFEFTEKNRATVNAVRLPIYLNLAACYLNQDQLNLDKVIEYGQLALEIDKSNTKALFRTGRAHLLKGELDQAKSKLKQASKNQPNDKAIREALQELKEALVIQREKEKKLWGGRFASMKKNTQVDLEDSDDDDNAELKKKTTAENPLINSLLVLLVAILIGIGAMFYGK